VITRSGEIIGRVSEVRLDGFCVEGVVVERPLFSGSVFIDKSFIKVFNQNEVLLKINPVTELVGVKVYDGSGRKLGRVSKVLRDDNKNNFKSLVVKDGFFRRPLLVDRSHIEIMKKNIILNVESLERSKGKGRKR
jgi:sporulation protein YlmC with PRC-barrel domain